MILARVSPFNPYNAEIFLYKPWRPKGVFNMNSSLAGIGMISSSTFLPHLGRVIRDLFRLLDAVYGIVRKH